MAIEDSFGENSWLFRSGIKLAIQSAIGFSL
jgi:hypothetical protein